MNKIQFFFVLIFFPLLLLGQGISIVPSKLPKEIFGSWINNKNEIKLILANDYVVIHNSLFYYNEIIKEGNIYEFTVVNNDDIQYFKLIIRNNKEIVIDEGYAVATLVRLKVEKPKNMPENVIGNWHFNNNLFIISND